MLCQDKASYSSTGGDSGSPVFKIINYPNTNDVLLYGIHWGSGGVFSAIGKANVKRSSELGGFVVADTVICPSCGTWDHYYAWRGGSQASNKAVWWAANKFLARYNMVKYVRFNSGGGSSGYADSAYVKIFRNEAMTDLMAEKYVSNINDYGETTVTFSSVPLNPGQYYWWQVHTGTGSQILLYFSNYGSTDYTLGCAYWRKNATYSDCTNDLNGRIQQ